MKKFTRIWLYPLILLGTILMFTNTCKKDESSDEREKFIGTWTGILYFSAIGREFNTTEIITKSTTNSAQIIITNQLGSYTPRVATVYGNSYIYQNFTASIGIPGNYTGAGSINGAVLTESGTISSNGAPYQGNLGTWGRKLAKQK